MTFLEIDLLGVYVAPISLLIIAAWFATIGLRRPHRTLYAMWTGEVDYNWAKEHHDLWLDDERAKHAAGPPRYPSATPAE